MSRRDYMAFDKPLEFGGAFSRALERHVSDTIQRRIWREELLIRPLLGEAWWTLRTNNTVPRLAPKL